MPALMERTLTVDRLLDQQAGAKLRQYGWSFDDVFVRSLIAIVSVQGSPETAFSVPVQRPVRRHPGGLRGRVHIAPDFDRPSDEMADLFENSSI